MRSMWRRTTRADEGSPMHLSPGIEQHMRAFIVSRPYLLHAAVVFRPEDFLPQLELTSRPSRREIAGDLRVSYRYDIRVSSRPRLPSGWRGKRGLRSVRSNWRSVACGPGCRMRPEV